MTPLSLARAALYLAACAGAAYFTDARALVLAHAVGGTVQAALLTALALCAALFFAEALARRVAPAPIALAATALCATSWLDALRIGADVWSIACFAALLYALERRSIAGSVAATLVCVVWCNLSPAGLLAVPFALAVLLGTAADRAGVPVQRDASFAFVGAAVALCLTPHGLQFVVHAWRALDLDNVLSPIYSNVPIATAPLGYRYGFFAIVALVLLAGARTDRWSQTFVFLLTVLGALASGALVPLAGVAAAPLLAAGAARFFGAGERAAAGGWIPDALATALPAMALCALVATLRVPASLEKIEPFGLLEHVPPSGVLFCTNVQWCDAAERLKGMRVVADAQVANAPEATIGAQRAIERGERHWRGSLGEQAVSAALVAPKSAIATLLAMDGWKASGSTPAATLFVRPVKP